MAIWKDKAGLKTQAAESTIVESTLDALNLLEQEKRSMSFEHKMEALKASQRLRNTMIREMGVTPDPKKVITHGHWSLDND